MKNLVLIEGDPFFISERLKEVDPSYVIYFNLAQKSYEVHSLEQVKNSYCFKVPYSDLDERTIIHAKRTRIENRDKIIAEIEKDNLLLEQKNIKKQVELIKESLC